jgi:hypothetical protein
VYQIKVNDMMRRRRAIPCGVAMALLAACGARPARAEAAPPPPWPADVARSIQNGMGSNDSVSGKTMAAVAAGAVGVVLLAVVVNARQNRQSAGGWTPTRAARSAGSPPKHSGKLVKELMRETGLTRGQVRQLEAANARLADEDRGVEHLATLLLCPSLLAAARNGGER